MLTCYDFTTARLMQEAGVPMLLVGDSAANVILGHDTTLPVLARVHDRADRGRAARGAAGAGRGGHAVRVVRDVVDQGVRNVCRMVKLSGCDCVKMEVAPAHAAARPRLADAGVAVMAHLGLRPQTVGLLGGYKFQGRTAAEADAIVVAGLQMQRPAPRRCCSKPCRRRCRQRVVERTERAGDRLRRRAGVSRPVVVTHDAIGLSAHARRGSCRKLGDAAPRIERLVREIRQQLERGTYPAAEHSTRCPPTSGRSSLRRSSPDLD